MSDSRVGTVSDRLEARDPSAPLESASHTPQSSSSRSCDHARALRVGLLYNKRLQVPGTILLLRWQPYLLLHESSSPYLKGTGKFGNVEIIIHQTEGGRDRESINTVSMNQLPITLAACNLWSTFTTSSFQH